MITTLPIDVCFCVEPDLAVREREGCVYRALVVENRVFYRVNYYLTTK